MRKYTIFVLGAIWLLLASLVFCAEETPKPAVQSAQLKDAPITIDTSTVGRFTKGMSWHLNVNSPGQAELTIETFPKPTVKRFNVPKDRMAEFRKALFDERFFELASEYGQQVVDGSTKTLTVKAGERTNTVKVYFLMNWVHYDKAKLREPSRAVRLLVMLRGWIDDPQAVDLRKYDRMVLDAARKQVGFKPPGVDCQPWRKRIFICGVRQLGESTPRPSRYIWCSSLSRRCRVNVEGNLLLDSHRLFVPQYDRHLGDFNGPIRLVPTANSSIHNFWACGRSPGPK